MKVTDDLPGAPAFGTLLRRYRLSAGFSQEALAERANLSVEGISTLERGTRRAPYPGTIDLIAAALELGQEEHRALASAVVRHRATRQQRRMSLLPLPLLLTRLIGRDRELTLVRSLMQERSTRLLTITGVGGVGKTRFALELAHRISQEFEDGASFVSLAAIRDPAHVALALGQCLERRNDDESTTFDALCAQIADRRALLVIDNFEQVLAGGPLLTEFLTRCSRAVIVVTSREALRVTGEHEFLLQPLPLDDAVDLLIDKSLSIRPDLNVKARKDSLVSICRRLDGLPLAIELAAARLRHYPVTALLERLSSRLDVLVSGTRDSPPRQRTMRDAIEWSYQLLSDEERAIFQTSSLFAGGGTPEALAVLAKETDSVVSAVDELVTSLADKHLISVHESGVGLIRFEMLETIREYAYEQLEASGRLDRVQAAFAEYYAGLASRAAPHLRGPEAGSWFHVITREYENFRSTLRWAVVCNRSLGLRLALDLRYFWSRGGFFAEAREWLEALVDPEDQTIAREEPQMMWQVMNLRALSHAWVGDEHRACSLYPEVLEIARNLNDQKLIARTLNNFGSALHNSGDSERSRLVLEESLAIKEIHDDAWSIATTLSNLGMALRGCREYPLALERHRQALDLFRSTDDRWGELAELNDIADIFRDQRNYAEAASFYKASLDANVGGIRPLAADSFEGLAAVAASRALFRQVAVLAGAADTIHKETGRSIAPPDRPPFDAACASSREAIGASGFDEAWSEGAVLPLTEAIEIAQAIAKDLSS